MIKNKQEIFFEHIKQIFLQNPHLEINYHTIYGELMIFNTENDKISRIGEYSLVGTQSNMHNKYKHNNCVNVYTAKKKYFWVIENRTKLEHNDFYNELGNSIKLYVAVDPSNIDQISSTIFDFIISENILSQSKISKEFRNDALVLRIRKKEDAEKIISFINDINYTSQVKPNPFVYNMGNVSMAIDGTLSYNSTFCKLLASFLDGKKNSSELESASLNDFKKWIPVQIDLLKSGQGNNLRTYYEIEDNEGLQDFIMVSEILLKNIDGTISKDDIYYKQSVRSGKLPDTTVKQADNEFDYILHIMNGLVNKYGIEEAHQRVMCYVKNHYDATIFTRDKNIRKIVVDYFTPSKMKGVLENLGYDALINAVSETINKYNLEQARYAVSELIEKKNIECFTNDNDARSYLGFIVPMELLEESIIDKINEQGIYPSKENIINMVTLDAEKINKNKGRK